LLAADRLVSTPALKRELWQRTRAVAVDMESGRVLAAAAARRRPALVVRGVADTASEALSPELASVVDVRGRVRLARAARVALRRPDLVPQAMRMARTSRNALRAVASVLAELRRSLSERPEPSDEDAVASSFRNAAAGSPPTMTGRGP
jgi:adenosylhomocysteine nucleosidase